MKGKSSRSYYPVFLDVRGRKCVVVGGGQVACRKAEGLLECGADVEVISPDLGSGISELAGTGKIKVFRKRFNGEVLQGALIAVAATDDEDINREVAEEARRRGVLVNVVDDAPDSDYITPSCLRRGKIVIAISTSGSSPALARKIRTVLEKDFGEEYAALAGLVEEVRTGLKRNKIKVDSERWQKALDLGLMLELLRKGDREKARTVLLNKLKEV
jgi:precorrin-2 dehydrogenase/sirohydrochlorin ferrochelatase